ncbi:stalk domain-containing protein [Paenibacillus sp. RC84]|uniref:stalk domain-containing protein n=1 Tax=Paenibacillus sp. RC84 TaxID=3156252 RepID=UPI003512D3F4
MKSKKPVFYLTGGILIGTLFSQTDVWARPVIDYLLQAATYPVTVDGQTYSSPDLPLLNYEGSTYVPLKSLGDLLGASVTWNDSLKQAEIHKTKPSAAKEDLSVAAKDYYGAVEQWTFDTLYQPDKGTLDEKGRGELLKQLETVYGPNLAARFFDYGYMKESDGSYLSRPGDHLPLRKLNRNIIATHEIAGGKTIVTIKGEIEYNLDGKTFTDRYKQQYTIDPLTLKIIDIAYLALPI